MDEETSIRVCGLIAGVLSADAHMHAHEASFLQRARKHLGVPKGAPVAPVLDRNEAVATLQRLPEDVRQETLELLVQAAVADGKVAPEERDFLAALAGELRVGAGDIEQRLESAVATSKPQPFAPAEGED
jgi:uncharacterized tellurite resistance protein B-like protein